MHRRRRRHPTRHRSFSRLPRASSRASVLGSISHPLSMKHHIVLRARSDNLRWLISFFLFSSLSRALLAICHSDGLPRGDGGATHIQSGDTFLLASRPDTRTVSQRDIARTSAWSPYHTHLLPTVTLSESNTPRQNGGSLSARDAPIPGLIVRGSIGPTQGV